MWRSVLIISCLVALSSAITHDQIYQGIYEGFYTYYTINNPTGNSLPILFFSPQGQIFGEGEDSTPIGVVQYSLTGTWTDNTVYWEKQYHTDVVEWQGVVVYEGSWNGNKFEGQWKFQNSQEYGGYFHFQPRHLIARDLPEHLSPDWVRILGDQMHRAGNGEPSIFGWGEKNLVWKNLSMQEVIVIFRRLTPDRYPAVLRIYYATYRLAIDIGDDSERNAKRHSFWQISLVNTFGVEFARELGDAHEQGRPGTAEDNRVDEHNNRVAVDYAIANPGSDALQSTNILWDAGILIGYSDDHPHPNQPDTPHHHFEDEF